MSVTLRKDGRWMVTYKIDGKTCWEYFGKGLQGEKKARARDKELKSSGVINSYTRMPAHMTSPVFRVLVEEYLSAKVIELPKTSIQNMVYKFKSVILPELGDNQAMKINAERL